MIPTELPLARATVDRAAERRSDPGLVARLRADPTTRVVLVREGLVATTAADDAAGLHLLPAADAAALHPGPATSAAATPAPAAPDPTDPDGAGATPDPGDASWLFLGADADRSYLALVLPDPAPDLAPDATSEPAAPRAAERSPRDVPPADAVGVAAGPDDGAAAPDADPAARLAALHFSHLRRVGAAMPARDAGLAVTAVALAAWHRTHRCCPRCGTPTVVGHAGWVRTCPTDGRDQYPRTDPAVIMAVVDDDDRLLLGHAAHWPERRYSTLAGYVEPGEGLEQAVRREVAEEVGVAVGEVEYRGSQPWPFPASLMLGFRARATSTDITVDAVEITLARWFTRPELAAAVDAGEVLLPMRSSIARALIEEWAGAPLPGE